MRCARRSATHVLILRAEVQGSRERFKPRSFGPTGLFFVPNVRKQAYALVFTNFPRTVACKSVFKPCTILSDPERASGRTGAHS